MKNDEHLIEYVDTDTNMMAYVIKATTGKFHACLKDLDSNQVIPHIEICEDLDTASGKAKKMIEG
jgi:hypothetical protein